MNGGLTPYETRVTDTLLCSNCDGKIVSGAAVWYSPFARSMSVDDETLDIDGSLSLSEDPNALPFHRDCIVKRLTS